MKILYIINDIDFFISHRLPLAEYAVKSNYKVFVAANQIPKAKIQGVKFLKFDINRSSISLISNLNSLFQIHKLIKNISPNIVHNITLKPILFTSIILLLNKKIRVVNAVSGLGFLFTNDRFSISKLLVKNVLRIIINFRKPFFIFQNNHDLSEFKKLGLNDQYTIINGSGVDKLKFNYTKPTKKNKLNLVFTGRILKDKGIIELIKAMKILEIEFKNKIILNVYGKIDTENPAFISENEFNKLLIPEFILWHGYSKNIKEVLIDSDIYCLPSYREGIPKSTVEAMAIGRPILTTYAPGCDDTVKNGENGFKVPIGDWLELSKKIKFLIENESIRIEMGIKSRKFFEEKFTLKQVINQTLNIYEKIL